MSATFPPEIFALIVDSLVKVLTASTSEAHERRACWSALRACSNVSAMLWNLTRPHIFRRIHIMHDYGSEATLELLLELMNNDDYTITPLVEDFKVVVPGIFFERTSPFVDLLVEVLYAFLEGDCLCELEVEAMPSPLRWGAVANEEFKDVMQCLFESPNLDRLGLWDFKDLPRDVFGEMEIRSLTLLNCTAEWSEDDQDLSLAIQAPPLIWMEITTHEFPFFQIYSGESEDPDEPLPYSTLIVYMATTTAGTLETDRVIMERSALTLRTVKLNIQDNLAIGNPNNGPPFDLSRNFDLSRLEIEYARWGTEGDVSDLAAFVDKFLRPSSPVQSLTTLVLKVRVSDRTAMPSSINESTKEFWTLIDTALSHPFFSSLLRVTVLVPYTVTHVNTRPHDAEFLGVTMERLRSYFPMLSAAESVDFHLAIHFHESCLNIDFDWVNSHPEEFAFFLT